MSFWSKLFGGGDGAETPAAPAAEAEHKGFRIVATPFTEGGQFQTCGIVSKEIDGVVREQRFVRADRFSTREDAADHTLRKGRQIIDEQGDRLFE